MGEKIRLIIIIGLAAMLAVSSFISLGSINSKKAMELEKKSLINTNENLARKIEEFTTERKQLQDKIHALSNDLDKASQGKEDVQKRYDLMVKERDGLAEKLKVQAAVPVKEPEKKQPPVTQDEYWAAVLKEKEELSLKAENMRSELNTLKINNEKFNRDLNNLTSEKQELEKQASYSQKLVDNMTTELVIRRNAERQAQDNLKYIKSENKVLRRQLKSLSNLKANLGKKLVQLQEEKTRLESRLNETAVFLEDRLSDMKSMKQQLDLDAIRSGGGTEEIAQLQKEKTSVELAPIFVHPQSETETPQKDGALVVQGSIVEVNKENKFVIIDLGQDLGIKVGDTFRVYREDKAIAKLRVIRVRQTVAACDIKEEITPIQAGDIVR